MSENKLNFGITQETKATNAIPILVATKVENDTRFPNGWKFPVATLVNVVYNPEFDTKDGKRAVLQFVFRDADKRQHTHIEWEVDNDDAKVSEKLDWLSVRVKHIFTTVFGGFPKEGIGNTATNFKEYFDAIGKAFNDRVDEAGHKLYAKTPVYIKLTYYKKNLGLPLSPNFLEAVIKDSPCKTLNIHPVHDKLEPSGGGAKGVGLPPMGSGMDDLPSFGNDFN